MVLALTSYDWLKTFHVIGAVIWAGGGSMLILLALLTERENDPVALARLAKHAHTLGQFVFTPLALTVLGLGIALVENDRSPWEYGDFFVLYGLVAFGVSFAIGAGFLGPESGRLEKLLKEHGPEDAETQRRIRRLLGVARLDAILLLSIVFFMTLKPFL